MKFLITFSKSIGFLACLFLGFSPAFSQSLVAIPNPDGHILASDLREDDVPFFFDGKLVARLRTQVQNGYVYKLALFDGQNYSIVENPDNGKGYMSHPIIFNNSLYVKYALSAGYHVLAKLTGNRLVIVPNPAGYFYEGSPFIYKNRMYFRCNNTASETGIAYLAYFNGSSIDMTNNPITSKRNIIYKDNFYFISYNKVIKMDTLNQSIFFDNTSSLHYYIDDFVIHKDSLFMIPFKRNKLFKTDGNTIQEIVMPNSAGSPYPYAKVSSQNKLYLFYADANGYTKLLEYNNGNIRLFNNVNNGNIDVNTSNPIIYGDTLFFHYLGNQNTYHLAKLDGNNISLSSASSSYTNFPVYSISFRGNFYYGGRELSALPGPIKLLRYNGNSIISISAPDSLGLVPSMPIIFNNKLYVKAIRHLAVLEQEGGSVATQNIVTDNIKIFPNPANQLLNIILEDGQIGKIDIFNLLGQKVLTKNLLEQNNQLGIESLSSGTYLVNILIGEKTVHKTFIKQ